MRKLSKKMLKRRGSGREGKGRRKRRKAGRGYISLAPFIPKRIEKREPLIYLPRVLHEQSGSPYMSIIAQQ
jgi:hypothetical protein